MPAMTNRAPTTRSDEPDPAVEGVVGEQPDQGDRQQHHRDRHGGEDDDPEDDGPGGQGQRSDASSPGGARPRCRPSRRPGRAGRRCAPGPAGGGRGGGRRAVRFHRARIVAGRWPPTGPPVGGLPGRDHAGTDRAGAGVGPHHGPEVGHHDQRVLGPTPWNMATNSSMSGGSVAHGQAADGPASPGLVGQVAQRAGAGPLLGLLLRPSVGERHHRLDGEQRSEQGPGPADPPPFSRWSSVSTTP